MVGHSMSLVVLSNILGVYLVYGNMSLIVTGLSNNFKLNTPAEWDTLVL